MSGWVGLCLAALCAAIEFGIQPMLFTNASGAPLYCPFPLSVAIPAMLVPHMLVAGVIEGVATAAIYGFIKKTAPSIIVGPEAVDGQLAADGTAKKTSLIPTLILVAVLVVATPLGLLATGDAWGEWDAEGAATAVQEAGDDSLQLRSASMLRPLPMRCPRATTCRFIPRSRALALPARPRCIFFRA